MATKPISGPSITRENVGAPSLPALVTLFQVMFDPPQTLYFVGSDAGGDLGVAFAGNDYLAYPVAAKGFAWSADGPPARPTLELANLNGIFDKAVESQTLLGKPIQRILTMVDELDPPHGTGGGACFPPEQWIIDRVARLDDRVVRLELSAAASLESRSFPQRLILRDLCQHSYRRWSDADDAFSYENVSCPYAGRRADEGAQYFRRDGRETANPADDACSLQLDSGCKKRFPTGPLPFLGFPGVTKL